MKIFDRSLKLKHVSYDIRGSTFDEATRIIANGRKVLRLDTGSPVEFGSIVLDEAIRDLTADAHNNEAHSDSKGILSARRAIMRCHQSKGLPHVDIDDICPGNGASELISMSLQALLGDSDEVLVPMPNYPLRTARISLAGDNAVHYLYDEKASWYPDIDDIKSKVASNTKAIVMIDPNNPTGTLYPDEPLKEIVEIARQNDLTIFAGEIYDRLVMDGKKYTATTGLTPDVFCVSVNGLLKSHQIYSFYVGWIILSSPRNNVKDYIKGLNMLANMRLCANVLGQHVAQTSLGGYQPVDELLIPGSQIYGQRSFIYEAVNEVPGPSTVKPDAGLYIFPRIDREMYQVDDDEQFCLELLKQEKVMSAPGKEFNWNEPDHFRIVYLSYAEESAEVQEKLTRVLSQYRR